MAVQNLFFSWFSFAPRTTNVSARRTTRSLELTTQYTDEKERNCNTIHVTCSFSVSIHVYVIQFNAIQTRYHRKGIVSQTVN